MYYLYENSDGQYWRGAIKKYQKGQKLFKEFTISSIIACGETLDEVLYQLSLQPHQKLEEHFDDICTIFEDEVWNISCYTFFEYCLKKILGINKK